jgi:hypothetical protein
MSIPYQIPFLLITKSGYTKQSTPKIDFTKYHNITTLLLVLQVDVFRKGKWFWSGDWSEPKIGCSLASHMPACFRYFFRAFSPSTTFPCFNVWHAAHAFSPQSHATSLSHACQDLKRLHCVTVSHNCSRRFLTYKVACEAMGYQARKSQPAYAWSLSFLTSSNACNFFY